MLFIIKTPNCSARHFRNVVRFASTLPYINPARASPELATRVNDKLMLATDAGLSRQYAVLLTTGVISECQLVTPGYFGSSSTQLCRRISIYPLHTEHQRTVAFIRNMLNHEHSYLGPLYNGVLSFSTRNVSNVLCVLSLITIYTLGNSCNVFSYTASPSTPTRHSRPVMKLRQQAMTNFPGSLGFNNKGMPFVST